MRCDDDEGGRWVEVNEDNNDINTNDDDDDKGR